MKEIKICCAGEVMVELARVDDSGMYRQGLAGDSFNTAIYLARGGLQVEYLTRLGTDAFSESILEQLRGEGIDSRGIRRVAGANPGLYLIRNDEDGERHFSYWREHSPARQLFDRLPSLEGIDAFYFTGITLAVTRSGKTNLQALLVELRERGVQVIFDPNYRPSLWDSQEQARHHYEAVLPMCDMVLPTLEDETALWGIDSVEDCNRFYSNYSVSELVIKGPQLVAHVFTEGERLSRQASAVVAVDATGAGDSFNAGYLVRRLRGESPDVALNYAQSLAAAVVQHRGAILPRETQKLIES